MKIKNSRNSSVSNLSGSGEQKANRYSPAHLRRRLKTLCASTTALSDSVAKLIAREYWRSTNDDEATIILASLLLGWSIEKVLSITPNEITQCGESYYLRSPWQFSEPAIPEGSNHLLLSSSDQGLIPLPANLATRLLDVIATSSATATATMKTQVKDYLAQKLATQNFRTSLSGIRRNLEYSANACFLSPAELDFIHAIVQRYSMQSFYISFEQDKVHTKLISYQTRLLGLDATTLKLTPWKGNFGSKRALKFEGVRDIFQVHRDILSQHWQLTQPEFHNAFTSYVIDLYHLVTAARPSGDGNLTRLYFAPDISSVLVKDKGDTSLRRTPIPYSVQRILQNYLQYLEYLQAEVRMIYPRVASSIGAMLDGSDSFFQYWDLEKRQLLPVDSGTIQRFSKAHFDLHANWHRHTIATHLVKQDSCRESLAVFMGHNPDLDHCYSELSSLSYTSLEKVGKDIAKLIESWKLPLLSPLAVIKGDKS